MLFNAIAGRADRKWVVLQGWWARHAPLVRAKSIRPVELLVSGHPEINENERKKKHKYNKNLREKKSWDPLSANGCNARMSSTTSPSARQSDICR